MSRAGQYVGKSIPMLDAPRFTRGLGQYINDLPFVNAGVVAFVRSTEAHARIFSLDVSAAVAHPDAIAVLTADDLESVLKGRYWGGINGTRTADYFPLARGKVRWVGEPVVAIVAESRYVAEDIAELVTVEYEPLSPVTNPIKGRAESGDALLYEEWGTNVYYHASGDWGDVDEAFSSAAGVVKRSFTSQRHTATPMEPRGVVADYNRGKDTMTLHVNCQDVFLMRAVMSQIFDIPPSRFRVVNPDTGGAFGVKLPVYPEEVACTAISIKLGRPIKWIQDRQEDLLGTSQHRDLHITAEMAYDASGKIVGLKADVISDAGAYGVPARGNTVEGIMAAEDIVAAGHDITNYRYSLDVVLTNKAPTCVFRGVAQPITVYVMDALLDDVARAVGVSRREIRRVNLIKRDQFPYEATTGYVLEQGSYVEAMDKALDLIGYESFEDYRASMRVQGRIVGLGISCGAEATSRGASWYGKRGLPISGQDGCLIKIDPTGRVHAQLGTTTQGQGLETALAQLIADELGVRVEDVRVTMGDTESSPYGSGTWGSRCAVIGGSAAHRAATDLAVRVRQIASHMLECSHEDILLAEGRASVIGSPDRSVSMEDVAKMAYFFSSDLPAGTEPGLEAVRHFDPPIATFSNSCYAVIVEIDAATGRLDFQRWVAVDDCGTVLNPMLVAGQLYGGIAHGIGGTIHEHLIYDESGQPQCTTFMDYLLPTALDVPNIEISHIETPSPHTALGVKGVGESGTVFTAGAITSGVADALGIAIDHVGLSPWKVHSLVQRAIEAGTLSIDR